MNESNFSQTPVCPKCKGNMEPEKLMSFKFTSFISDSEPKKIVGKGIKVTAHYFGCYMASVQKLLQTRDPR